ncbi:MAG: cation diffusion facilitator family transporter [Clostridium sp.]|nr:cation diffusion facilitator family transporter [Clostridium sp.]
MLNVLLNIALFIFKFIGGNLSGSVSVIADAFNNLSDAGTTLATYLGVKVASVGSGEHHPNGHGRAEWVIALMSSTSVIIIGWELGRDSLESITNPEASVFSLFTVLVLLISISVKMFMYFYNMKMAKEKDSQSYKAVAVDSLSDSFSTCAVLISLILYRFTGINADGWCGLLVSVFIIYNGFSSFSETAGRIMGKAPSRDELDNMREFVLENKDYQEVYDLQIEDFGYGRHRVSLIVLGREGVSGDTLIGDVAETTAAIYEKFGYSVLISVEKPIRDENYENIKTMVDEIVNSQTIDVKLLSMRISDAGERKMLRMEIGVPHEKFKKLEEVEKNIHEQIKNLPPEYAVIPKVRLMRDFNRIRHKRIDG